MKKRVSCSFIVPLKHVWREVITTSAFLRVLYLVHHRNTSLDSILLVYFVQFSYCWACRLESACSKRRRIDLSEKTKKRPA